MGMIDQVREAVADAPGDVVAVYLYGSHARATASETSDIDLGLLLTRPPAPTLRGVVRDVEAAIEEKTRKPVQAVALNRAPADLVHRILRDGVILLDRDKPARLRFEVRARNDYFDLAPLRRLYRHASA